MGIIRYGKITNLEGKEKVSGEQKIRHLLQEMWQDYLKLNPQAQQIIQLFEALGENASNDHLAFRTYGIEGITMAQLARPFVAAGYKACGEYRFEQKKLVAQHFEHQDQELPKIFISELLVKELSLPTQSIIQELIEQMDGTEVKRDNFLYSGRPWKIDSQSYEKMAEESKYAAWVAAFGFRPNHFTISVNSLKAFDDVEDVNKFLKSKGIALNTSGGEVKGSKEALLKQSSTLANEIKVKFSDRSMAIPGCYYEFAKRFTCPNGKLYQGFVSASADKIF